MNDLIDRQAAINALWKEPSYSDSLNVLAEARDRIKELPSAQPEDWMERNKERILQAGMEGREVEFYIGGRLFAIREIAQ